MLYHITPPLTYAPISYLRNKINISCVEASATEAHSRCPADAERDRLVTEGEELTSRNRASALQEGKPEAHEKGEKMEEMVGDQYHDLSTEIVIWDVMC